MASEVTVVVNEPGAGGDGIALAKNLRLRDGKTERAAVARRGGDRHARARHSRVPS